MSVAAAREVVGQPHLSDHALYDNLKKPHGGPVHLIACHKGATEAQARTMLGFPDATVVSPLLAFMLLILCKAFSLFW
jgi:hypothetical protein